MREVLVDAAHGLYKILLLICEDRKLPCLFKNGVILRGLGLRVVRASTPPPVMIEKGNKVRRI